MPQDVDFHLPFPERVSPDVPAAAERNLTWMRAHGLIGDERAEKRYRAWHLADLAGRFFPAATGPDLDLGVDAMGFFFLFDDLFDGPPGESPQRAGAVCDPLRDLTYLDPTGPVRAPFPLAVAWLDVWRRSVAGMSPDWRERAARHWRAYFESYVAEARNRRDRVLLDLPGYLALRRRSIATDPVLDLAERTAHVETADAAFHSRLLADVRRITSDVVILVNDVCSVEKEEARHDPHNVVLVLGHAGRADREQILARVAALVRERVAEFEALRATLATAPGRLGVDPADLPAVTHYLSAAAACMRGNDDWGRRSARYRVGVRTAAGDRPARLPDAVPG